MGRLTFYINFMKTNNKRIFAIIKNTCELPLHHNNTTCQRQEINHPALFKEGTGVVKSNHKQFRPRRGEVEI
jgi:hypothetical protein